MIPAVAPDSVDLAFLAGVLVLLHLARRWILLFALLAWPGTVLHELAHWLVATVLGGRPTWPSVIPERGEGGRWRLGSVGIRQVRWFNAVPIGLAPLLLAPAAAALLAFAGRLEPNAPPHWLALYGVAALATACLPSRADWQIVASRPFGAALWLALAGGAAWFAWQA